MYVSVYDPTTAKKRKSNVEVVLENPPVTTASAVESSDATPEASVKALRTTLAGSMIPDSIMSQ